MCSLVNLGLFRNEPSICTDYKTRLVIPDICYICQSFVSGLILKITDIEGSLVRSGLVQEQNNLLFRPLQSSIQTKIILFWSKFCISDHIRNYRYEGVPGAFWVCSGTNHVAVSTNIVVYPHRKCVIWVNVLYLHSFRESPIWRGPWCILGQSTNKPNFWFDHYNSLRIPSLFHLIQRFVFGLCLGVTDIEGDPGAFWASLGTNQISVLTNEFIKLNYSHSLNSLI